MKWVPDATGRFERRPHYEPGELDAECESVVTRFLRQKHGRASYPVATDDLLVLLESLITDLDVYADLSGEGPNVEGVTYFDPDGKPSVRIDAGLSEDPRREHRLRTTLAHELGHVVLHAFLWKVDPGSVTKGRVAASSPRCRREGILNSPSGDWMEWQAAYASGAFLMPRSALDAIVETMYPGRGIEPIPDRGSAANLLVRQVERQFHVSAEAARVRLYQTGHLGRATRVISVSKCPQWYKRGRGRSTFQSYRS